MLVFFKWSFGVRKGVCKLKIAIKSRRALNPAAARRSLAPALRMRISNNDVMFTPSIKFLRIHVPTSPQKREILHHSKNSLYKVSNTANSSCIPPGVMVFIGLGLGLGLGFGWG